MKARDVGKPRARALASKAISKGVTEQGRRAQELRKRRDRYPGLPVPNSPYDLSGRKAKLNLNDRAWSQSSGGV